MARAPTRQGQGKRTPAAKRKPAAGASAPAKRQTTTTTSDGFVKRGAVEVYQGRIRLVRKPRE